MRVGPGAGKRLKLIVSRVSRRPSSRRASLDCPACRGIGGDGILQLSVAQEGRTVCNSCGRYFTRTGASITAEEAVALMPEAVRQAFTLRKVYEFDHDEIARRMCLPLADIEQLIIQAARFLPVT
ncbi:MAG: sigma factor-like helix-turn-helix DNA-binding protein [Gammaproteobacteria bacterium]